MPLLRYIAPIAVKGNIRTRRSAFYFVQCCLRFAIIDKPLRVTSRHGSQSELSHKIHVPLLRKTLSCFCNYCFIIAMLLTLFSPANSRGEEAGSVSLGLGHDVLLGTIGYGADFGGRNSMFFDARLEFHVTDGFYMGLSGEAFSYLFYNGFAINSLPFGFNIIFSASYHFPSSGVVKPYVFWGTGFGVAAFIAYKSTASESGFTSSNWGCVKIGGGLLDIISVLGIEVGVGIYYPGKAEGYNAAFFLDVGIRARYSWGDD